MEEKPPAYEEVIVMAAGNSSKKLSHLAKDASLKSTEIPHHGWNFQRPQNMPSGLPVLDTALTNLPSIIRISDTEGRYQDEFFIRDTLDSLIFKADIDDENENFTKTIRVFNLNETRLLEIDCHVFNGESGDEDERTFQISHQEQIIGSLSLKKRDVESFSISNAHENRTYSINFINKMEVMISRTAYTMPMAKIRLEPVPHPLVEKSARPWISFNGSISFCDSNMTTVEQSIVIGLAMAIMMVTKENFQHKTCTA